MLKTVFFTDKIAEAALSVTPCVLALGGFDGLHAGHKSLLKKAKGFSLPVGIMTIEGGKGELPLFTLGERERIFSEAGADFSFELAFDKIRTLTPQEFGALLKEKFSPAAFVCGEDFRFGARAAGDATVLEAVTATPVYCEPLVCLNGVKVSSSTVKEALKNKDIPKANALLQEDFFLIGTVVKDRGVGKTLGFPTANILYPSGKFPLPQGVYETETEVGGRVYRGITNYGARPTFENGAVWVETYLDGFDGDLYGRELKISFKRFLREIVRFENADALKAQLKKDIGSVRDHDQIWTER